jgi:hypothetical protein
MNHSFLDYFRCPASLADFRSTGPMSDNMGFFRWGKKAICYGRTSSGFQATHADAPLYDALDDVSFEESAAILPFDPQEVAENLLRERYTAHFREPGRMSNKAIRKAYYLLRPYLSVAVRKHLQRMHLRNWNSIPFPEWPIDSTVDRLQRNLMGLSMRAKGLDAIPFIWFWPDGFDSCAILTHDVEAVAGKDYCEALMDLD